MDRKDKKILLQRIKGLTINANKLSRKNIRKELEKIFSSLLKLEGYAPDYDSMKRHNPDFIASKGVNKDETIAIYYREDNSMIKKDEMEELVAAATIDCFTKLIIVTEAIFEEDAFNFDKSIYDPVAIQQLNFNTLFNWAVKVEADQDETEIYKILRHCTQQIIYCINDNRTGLNELEWRDIERVIAELFRGLGFEVVLTPSSKDGGKDVILNFEIKGKSVSYIIEIKHWRSKQLVGEKSLTEFFKVVTKEKRQGGIFISTYGYVENAIESLTKRKRKLLRFGDKEKVFSLCNTYVKKKSGVWLEDKTLDQILIEDTN